MMNLLVAVFALAQVAHGLVPEMGSAGDTSRTLLGRRDLLQSCSSRWGQCGGKQWKGANCCTTGNTCQQKNEWYSQCMKGGGGSKKTSSNPPSKPSPSPPASPIVEQPLNLNKRSSGGGEYCLCISGSSETFGPTKSQREYPEQGSAVKITSSGGGSCSWEEYAGGFDGYPSPAVGDGHEKGMDMAIEQMFPGDRNKQNSFLVAMIQKGNPLDMDYPKDKAKADGGERMKNIGKLNSACSSLISICC